MAFSTAALRVTLRACVPAEASGLVVALSGGEDSGCLLAALAAVAADLAPLTLRAVHVDHGLQPAAASLRAAAATLCARLSVPLTVAMVRIDCVGGASVEEAARDARYAALAADMRPGECLLTAHHREDQAETLLLQALRGAGLKGLSAMPAQREFAVGWHLRPLLEFGRRELREFAAAMAVGIRDPMNEDPRYDRVYLRAMVWPLLERRWPGAAEALSRAAAHVAAAQGLLEDLADADLATVGDGRTLSVRGLRGLQPDRRSNAVRRWLAQNAVPMPSSSRLHEALRQMLEAASDFMPVACWDGVAMRRYRDRVHLTAAHPPRIDAEHRWEYRAAEALELGPGLGRLRAIKRAGGLALERLPRELTVRRRSGGEVLRPAADAATQTVQHLCQGLGVLPWMRDALPFIFAGSDLIAVGDLWLNASPDAQGGVAGLAFSWEDAPNIV